MKLNVPFGGKVVFQKGKTSELRMKGALNHLYESPVNILFSFFSVYTFILESCLEI